MNRCMYFYLKLYFGYVCILRCYLNFVVICKVCSLEDKWKFVCKFNKVVVKVFLNKRFIYLGLFMYYFD